MLEDPDQVDQMYEGISPNNSGKNQNFKKKKNLFFKSHQQSTMSKFQVPSSNGVGCGDGRQPDIHTYSHSMKTEEYLT